MYDYINGIFTYKMSNSKGNFVTVQTGGGVGYLFEVMDRDFAKLPEENSESCAQSMSAKAVLR